MRAGIVRIGLVIMAALMLSACADRDPRLNTARTKNGPDEFAILPNKPLQAPTDFAALPAPTPGGSNLSDPTPKTDAIVALGGRASAANPGGADGALIAHVARNGTDAGIREDLAEKDLRYRKSRDVFFLQRWFARDRYAKAYRRQALDPWAELKRLRAAGVKTPSAPPAP